MALIFSTGLRDNILDTGSLANQLSGGFLTVYSGTAPADADAALGAAVALVTYTESGDGVTGLTMDGAFNGAIPKNSAETWSGTAVADGTGTFFRYYKAADTGALSTTEVRIQGTVGGAGSDMFVQNTAFVTGNSYSVDYFTVAIPSGA